MSPEISERSFEDAIERGLLQNGPDAYADEAAAMRYKLAVNNYLYEA